MAKIRLPDNAPVVIREIIDDARDRNLSHNYNLMPYGTDTLKKGLKYIEDNNIYQKLQQEMRTEIRLRELYGQKIIHTSSFTWFTPYWLAVQSLFGKGTMDRNAPQTKALLAKIDPDWKFNCGGQNR